MVSDLRKQLDDKTTEELANLLRAHDLSEWRPEVFRIAKAILHERGVDTASLKPQTPPVHETRPDPPRFVQLLALPDPAMLMAARSLLEAAGLPFFVKNEDTQNLFGMGQMGGYNFVTGPPVLMVEATRFDEARELLEPLQQAAPPPREDEEDPLTAQLRARNTEELSDTESSEQSLPASALGRLQALELVAVLLVCVVPQLIARLEPTTPPSLTVMRLAQLAPWWLGVAGLTWSLLRHDVQWRAPLPRGSRAWLWELIVGCGLCAVMWVLESRTSAFLAALGVPPDWVDKSVYASAFRDPMVRVANAVEKLCAAAAEETVFRVYLLRRLAQLFGGSQLGAVLVSAALFALVHNRGFNYTLVLFLTGVVLGAVYLRSACLPRLVVAHWLHNLLVMAQYV